MIVSMIKKYKTLSLQMRAACWFTVANFILKGISFITVPLSTRLLSVSEYGIVSIFLSYQQFFLLFSTFELYLGAYQRGILQFKNDRNRFTRALILLCNFISAVMLFVTFLFRNIFIKLTGSNRNILLLMFLYFILLPGFNCWIARKRFDYMYKPAVIGSVAVSGIISVGTCLLVSFSSRTAENFLETTLILEILCYLPFYIKEMFPIKRGIGQAIKTYWKYCYDFQLPLVAHSLSYFILGQADRVMIGMFVNEEKAGIYSVAYSLANVVMIFQVSINQVMQPWRYKNLEAKRYREIKITTDHTLWVTGCLIIVFILIAPEIMKCLFSESYQEAVWTIPPIAVSVFYMMMYTIFTDVESYFYRTDYIMKASVICAVVNMILNYIGITIWGYIACGYTTMISYILFAFLHFLFMKKVSREAGMQEHLFNGRHLTMLGVLMMLAGGVCVLSYYHSAIRFCILGILLIFLCGRGRQLGNRDN
jgi:O-antigen/teichoic acid export membrane protein